MEHSFSKQVGILIRNFRKQQGLTQEQLAELAGTSFSFIGGVERGERNVTLSTIEKNLRSRINLANKRRWPF